MDRSATPCVVARSSATAHATRDARVVLALREVRVSSGADAHVAVALGNWAPSGQRGRHAMPLVARLTPSGRVVGLKATGSPPGQF